MTRTYGRFRAAVRSYLANDDPFASVANSGAFLVWSSQPLYPFYVWLLVGRDAWPALVTWLSTPVFFSVPIAARLDSRAGRALFVVAGVLNTLISFKAFGADAGIGWFLVPCGVIAATFFRRREWLVAGPLVGLVALAALVLGRLGAPLTVYDDAQNRSLSHLNLWSAAVLTAYLVYCAIKMRRKPS